MMHTAIMNRYNNESKIQKYDRTCEAKSVGRKIVLGTVKSIPIWTVMKLK